MFYIMEKYTYEYWILIYHLTDDIIFKIINLKIITSQKNNQIKKDKKKKDNILLANQYLCTKITFSAIGLY